MRCEGERKGVISGRERTVAVTGMGCQKASDAYILYGLLGCVLWMSE